MFCMRKDITHRGVSADLIIWKIKTQANYLLADFEWGRPLDFISSEKDLKATTSKKNLKNKYQQCIKNIYIYIIKFYLKKIYI